MLEKFEEYLFKLVKKIKFRTINDEFKRKKFLKFVVDINNLNKMWIEADKSRNIYKNDLPLYRKILHDKITEKCKLDQNNIVDQINKDTCNFTKKINVENRLSKLNRKKCIYYF